MMAGRRQRIIRKILRRVRVCPDTGCHEWTGPLSGDGRGGGYGRFFLDGQTCAVHIAIYVCFHGYIPGKLQVDHTCNNRRCCNPDHLELVTQTENQRRKKLRILRKEPT
jgi:hypothetical protein